MYAYTYLYDYTHQRAQQRIRLGMPTPLAHRDSGILGGRTPLRARVLTPLLPMAMAMEEEEATYLEILRKLYHVFMGSYVHRVRLLE